MNTITIADIKRGGMAALDLAMHRGAATIMKRNRPAAIVLTPKAYESLLARASNEAPANSALDWLLDPSHVIKPPGLALEAPAMAERLEEVKNGWRER